MMNEEYKITLDAPYPPAKADSCNIFYASLLTNDFAGPVSELSAVTQYTFQSLASKDQKAAALVSGIAKIEMHHMQLIGQLIASLGGIPRFAVQNGCGTSFWNGQLIGYDNSARDFLRENPDLAHEIENKVREGLGIALLPGALQAPAAAGE